jgi:hypothetical protein
MCMGVMDPSAIGHRRWRPVLPLQSLAFHPLPLQPPPRNSLPNALIVPVTSPHRRSYCPHFPFLPRRPQHRVISAPPPSRRLPVILSLSPSCCLLPPLPHRQAALKQQPRPPPARLAVRPVLPSASAQRRKGRDGRTGPASASCFLCVVGVVEPMATSDPGRRGAMTATILIRAPAAET